MNPFYRPQITDELLSAYIDGAVTNEEKIQIEKAVQIDANVAWRLESLRQTVNLLRSLPEVPLPRSFVLTEADVAPQNKSLPPFVTSARRINPPPKPTSERSGFWESLRDFLQGGSPALRNLAGAGLAIWLVLFGATQINLPQTTITTLPAQEVDATNNPGVSVAVESTALSDVASDPQPSAVDGSANRSVAIATTPTEVVATENYSTNESITSQSPPIDQPLPTAEEVTPLASVAQSDNRQGMGGGQNEAGQAPLPEAQSANVFSPPPGEDTSSPLDQILGEGGGPTAAPAEVAVAAADAATTNTEEAMSSTVDPAAAPVAKQPGDSATGNAGSEDQAAESALESPRLQVPDVAPQPAAESANAAAAPAVEPTPTPFIEPTATLEIPTPAQPAAQEAEATVAPTPTAVEVAIQSASGDLAAQKAQLGQVQQVETVTEKPLFDPVRMQFAQLLVALVTAVLALFWLGSHMSRRG